LRWPYFVAGKTGTGRAKQVSRKLTLFVVCAFEITLILFVAAWTALINI
jgi:hypothetical protein